MNAIRTGLFVSILLAASPSFAIQPPPSPPARPARMARADFEELAQRWLAEHDLAPASPSDLDLNTLLEEEFLAFPLGLFDVRIPPEAMRDPVAGQELRDILGALLDLQEAWIAWFPDAEATKEVRGDVKQLRGWIRAWKPMSFRDITPAKEGGVIEALAPKDSIRQAHASFAAYMLGGGPLGEREKRHEPARLVLFPGRAGFVEFTALLGWMNPRWRACFWDPGIVTWTDLELNGVRFLSLAYADPDAPDYRRGIPMSARNPRAAAEHVVQVATRALLDTVLADRMEPMLAAGLANNMVIELFGEVDTRSDGDTRTRRSDARSVFIPGGNPNGGVLPPTNANSRWRDSMGKDHFVKSLRRAQKAGGKDAASRREKHLVFQLLADDGAERSVVRAPFFGPEASDASIPTKRFQGDYLEFLRAYRSGFLHWLREHGGKSRRDSPAAFGRLLRRFAVPGGKLELTAVLQEIYEVPLSATDPNDDCLEGRFLLWLAKQ